MMWIFSLSGILFSCFLSWIIGYVTAVFVESKKEQNKKEKQLIRLNSIQSPFLLKDFVYRIIMEQPNPKKEN